MQFMVDVEKAIEASLFIINKLGGECDIHKLFKILYFAEKDHLAKYGRPITADRFIAMKDGPVPSNIYDAIKTVRGDAKKPISFDAHAVFSVRDKHYVSAKRYSDNDYLSETDIECLDESLALHKHLSYGGRVDASHDSAWKNTKLNSDIDYIDIAKAAGAKESLMEYIICNMENQNAFSYSVNGR